MSSKRNSNRVLKSERVKRILQMVEDTFISSDEEIIPKASTSSKSDVKALSKDDIIAVDPESSLKETYSNQVLSRYNLRVEKKKKYADTDQESSEDFSPDASEYVPNPRTNILKSPLSSDFSLSGDSAGINKMISYSEVVRTPSTISNLSVYLNNTDFVASTSEIFIPTPNLFQPSIEPESPPGPNLRRSINSQEDTDDTLKPEEISITNLNETLTGRSSNDCSYIKEVVSNNVDSPSLIWEINGEEEKNKTLITDMQSESNKDTNGRGSSVCLSIAAVESNHEDIIEVVHNSLVHIEEIDNNSTESNIENQPSTSKEKRLTRKRKQNVIEWRRNKNKMLKNSGKAYEGCNSKKKYPEKSIGSPCSCKKGCSQKFSPSDRQAIFENFYKLADRERQWLYISRCVQSKTIKRMALDRKNKRMQTLNYSFTNSNFKEENIPVCKKFFLNTLQIGEYVVYTALEKVFKAEEGIQDKRGTHSNRPNKMDTMTETTIKTHIELFPKVQSHYIRSTSTRNYLSENLNISKMYRLYRDWYTQQNYTDVVMATKRQYETVFNTQYNYSFFKPKKDQCLSCSVYEQSDDTIKATLEENKNFIYREKKGTSVKKRRHRNS